MALEGVSSRITRLNQLLTGKTSGKKVPLLDKETLLDAFMGLYNECSTEFMMKDKNIATYVKKFKPLISEIAKLRLKKSDFEIRKTIGRGHFGEVHVVREKVTGNVYAMKVLKKSETLSQDNVAFFEEERDIMAFANNPWITSLQYAFQDFESLYLVMDFHPGGDLLSLLAKYDDIFEEDIAKFYLAEMIMAIHTVHALGYVHRDIKPENVLIDRVGHIKLADFGSSAKLSSAKMVVSKMPVGTPEYIAPEVLMSMDGSGGGGKYGIECDWWSLGVVAYEMMVGNTPFQADSVVVVYSQIMNFKNSLQFPDDQPLTDNAKGLIRSLLTDQKNRIGYADLAKHNFFTGLDWTTLQDAVPPYVPTIAREDDTSNFDDFETENSGPRINDFMEQKKGFLGKDLPFIGFTFTKQLTLASLNETVNDPGTPCGTLPKTSSVKSRDSIKSTPNPELQILKTSLEKEHKKNKELKSSLDDKSKSILKLQSERDELENEKALYETERKDLKRDLEEEKGKREKSEKEITSLKKELLSGSKKAEEQRNEQIKSSLEEHQKFINQLEKEKSNITTKAQQLEIEVSNYQKQTEDSKTRISDLQAKLAKVNEDTKANVSELQQKLQKVTTDNENRIKQFQEKLVKAVQSAQELAEKLSKVEREKEDVEKEMVELKGFESQYKNVEAENQKKDTESGKTIESLQSNLSVKTQRVTELEAETNTLKEDLQESENRYDNLVEFGEDLKAQVERKIEKLQKELATSRKEHKKIETEYTTLKEEYEDKNNNLNTRDSMITTLQNTCQSLEQQLNDLMNSKEMNAKELDEKVQEERLQLTRKMSTIASEKLKSDNEINRLKTELKDSHETNARSKQRLDEARAQLEETTESYESTIQKLNTDLTKASDESNRYQKAVAVNIKNGEQLSAQIEKLKAELESHKEKSDDSEKLQEVENKLQKSKVAVENLKADKKVMEKKLQEAVEELSKIRKEKEHIQEELNEKEHQGNSQDLTIQMLKQTCTMLEGQVEELEVMNDEYQDRESQWNSVKRQQYQAQEKLEQQLTDALNTIEQHRQTKSKAEEKLRAIEDSVASSQSELEEKIEELQEEIKKRDEKLQDSNNSLSSAEKKNNLNSVTIKNLERKLATQSEETEKLTAEMSQLEDLSAQQTSSNFALTVEIEELKERSDDIVMEKEGLQNQLERNAFAHAEEKIKLESTLAQQTKLIDFLQKKVMIDDRNFAPNKKPKFKVGKNKSADHPAAPPADVRKTRDLEKSLEREKNANLQLHLQLQKAREEVTTLRVEIQQLKANLRSPSNPTTPRLSQKQDLIKTSSGSIFGKASPSTSVADIYQMAENEVRGNGNVPLEQMAKKTAHHLQQTLNMRAIKCPVCLNTVPFAQTVSKCTVCNILCHSKCAQSLQDLCGVPKSLLPHLAAGLSRSSMVLDDGSIAIDVTDGAKLPKIEGWLKFPRKSGTKQSWERKWVVLFDMKLSIYDNENTIEFDPFDEIDLNITDGELNIHPAIPASELIWAASNDVPYIFSIELLPYTLGWPRRTLYFLAPTFSDKQKWVAGLEYISDEVKKGTQKQDHGMVTDVIIRVEGSNPVDVNCAIMLPESGSILGAEDGLYVVSLRRGSPSKPVPVIGLGPVYQLALIKELELVLVIAGKERLFCYMDIKDLENRLKQLHTGSSISALSSHQIDKVKSCHMFTVAKVDNEFYACAATGHKLYILKYNQTVQSFVLKKEVETTASCSCLLLSMNSVIYGTNKFYSVDLKNFQKRDFLDASDTSLAFAVFGSSRVQSFPIAVFNVSKGAKREEFLLCYNEFGVFVDWQGRRSRKGDLKWSHLPLAFEYHQPHLYITHFASIEICEISSDLKSDISTIPRRFVDVPDPRFLGTGLNGRSILLASTQKNKLEIISYQADITHNNLSRNASTMSSMSSMSSGSGASVANAILENSGITLDPVISKSSSSHSICSDEETSNTIGGKELTTTPRSKRKDHVRNQEKDKNRISFRFFKANRKSQYDGH